MACKRCTACAGMTHHWTDDCEDAAEPTYTHVCLHCLAVGYECGWCDGDGLGLDDDDHIEPCGLCRGEGVRYVCDLALCTRCGTRFDMPEAPEAEQICAACR